MGGCEVPQRLLEAEEAWPWCACGGACRYGVHLVVANLLHTRYKEVQLVVPASARRVELGAGVAELENVFVPAVAEEHYSFIGDSDQPFGMPPPLVRHGCVHGDEGLQVH